MERVNEVVGKALTAVQAQRTKEPQSATSDPIPKSFAEFQTFGDRVLLNALNASVQFVREKRSNGEARWLTLCGPSGSGKTMLANAIAVSLGNWFRSEPSGIVTGSRAPLFYWPSIADLMRNGCWGAAQEIIEPPVAVIDDIGAEHDPNKVIADKLCHICNLRLAKWTVFTSNLMLKQIGDKIDPRISSRMLRGKNIVVEMNTVDFNTR